MTDKELSNLEPLKQKKIIPLGRGLILWFLLLSFAPLALFSWVSYQQAKTSLTNAAIDNLAQSAALNQKFIHQWFKSRFMDVNYQAENTKNTQLLMSLAKGWDESKKPLKTYIKSYQWTSIAQAGEKDLLSMTRSYEYIYDIFLIDIKGNILYSAAHESDLGTNIISGVYSDTKFAKAVSVTIKSGETVFSDLARYSPSGGKVSGFITSLVLDEQGNKIGVFAIQIRALHIVDVLNNEKMQASSLVHYLVGEDGLLRSVMKNADPSQVLSKKINTKQFDLWLNHQKGLDDTVSSYIGPMGNAVIGIHNELNFAGIHWVLMSEINEDEALSDATWLAKETILLLMIIVAIVFVIAKLLANRITGPIIELMNASRLVAAGEVDQKVKVNSDNEIGQLAEAFNHMLTMRQINEKVVSEKNTQAKAALAAFDEQKFAIDQHAIVAVANLKGDITYVNDKFTQISGYPAEELIGENHRILNSHYHEKSFFVDMYQTISKGKVWRGEVRNRARNGSLYWVDTTIVPTLDENNKPKNYIAIRTDITRRKKSEAELSVALEAANAATRSKSDFLANMSHEIRTPMNGIIGMTGLLLNTKLQPKQRDYADNTMKSADALLTIINDILDFSKIEAGKMELEAVPFDLRELSEDVSELMALKCREKNIEMLLRYKPGSIYNVVGDPGRIRQILLNLLSNAIKFTDKGSVVLSIETFPVAKDNIITVLLRVKDTGLGVEQDKLEKIFNKFDQEDGTTTRKYGGTGLGLSICRQLCNLMKGDIIAQSVKGQGSTFSFTMNLAADTNKISSTLSDSEDKELKEVADLAGLKTLVVDDLEISRIILLEQLSTLDLLIDSVDSGDAALVALKAAIDSGQPYDIVITDFYMPKMNGEMLSEEIKRLNLLEKGVLVFVTSAPREGDVNYLSAKGFDAYLTKPTHSAEFPKILSLAWNAKKKGKKIPLITRYSIESRNINVERKLALTDAQILLVEDNPINQMVATEYLEGYNCTVTPAGNGLEALAQLSERNFDLVFMDCQMPEMDGFEATENLRQLEVETGKHTPVIAFTANAMQGDKENCLAAGMDDFISKPINEKALQDILRKWLPNKVQSKDDKVENAPLIEGSDEEDVLMPVNEGEKIRLDLNAFSVLKQLFKDEFPTAVKKHEESALNNIKLMSEAVKISDYAVVERAAHSIKGASGQFGAFAFAACAKNIELYAIQKSKKQIQLLIPELIKEQQIVAELMLNELEDLKN